MPDISLLELKKILSPGMNNPDDTALKLSFGKVLLKWNRTRNKRDLPWKGEKDPYKIWLSEIILQQTRVEQGLAYYQRFIRTFPDINKLADARDAQVFKLWEGLGYYSRCSNLLHTARLIVNEKKGRFPETYDELQKLKGIGPYTAAAISSFAFKKPHAVVDGNVFRVLSRVFGINKPIDSTRGKNFFTSLANELIDKKNPGTYNQAIMDFGAVVCKPLPACNDCVLQSKCIAYLDKKIGKLPVRGKKQVIRQRWFYYLVMNYRGKLAIRQRLEKDIWKHLYEFPMIEGRSKLPVGTVIRESKKKGFLNGAKIKIIGKPVFIEQQLSHQLIRAGFIRLEIVKKPEQKNDWTWVHSGSLHTFSFPHVMRDFLQSFI